MTQHLTALRALRVVRVFKIVRKWRELRVRPPSFGPCIAPPLEKSWTWSCAGPRGITSYALGHNATGTLKTEAAPCARASSGLPGLDAPPCLRWRL